MKHERYVEYTLHNGAFSDVAGSRASARRKAQGWRASGFELTRIDKVVRESGTNRIINQVSCYTVNE